MSIKWILDVKGIGFTLNQIVIYWGKSFKLVNLLHKKNLVGNQMSSTQSPMGISSV